MRSGSSTLTNAQDDLSQSPYVNVEITTAEPSTTEDYNTDGVLKRVVERRTPWAAEEEIWLDNSDASLSSKDFRGRRVIVEWGYTTGSGDETVRHQPFWVLDQRFLSRAGVSYLVLTLADVWVMASHFRLGGDGSGAVPSYDAGTTTIQDIIDDLLDSVKPTGFTSAGIPLSVPVGNLDTTATFTTGIFKEYQPQITAQWNDAVRNIAHKTMQLTKCVLRMRNDAMYVVYPDPADAVDQEYSASSGYVHVEEDLHEGLTIPNEIIYINIPNDADGTNETHRGTASDTTSQNRIGVIAEIFTPADDEEIGLTTGTISGDDEAAQRADTILAQLQLEAATGTIRARPNVLLELYDKVQVDDPINGTSVTGRVGEIETQLDLRSGVEDRERWMQRVSISGFDVAFNSNILAQVRNFTDTARIGDSFESAQRAGSTNIVKGSGVRGSSFEGVIINRDGITIYGEATGPGPLSVAALGWKDDADSDVGWLANLADRIEWKIQEASHDLVLRLGDASTVGGINYTVLHLLEAGELLSSNVAVRIHTDGKVYEAHDELAELAIGVTDTIYSAGNQAGVIFAGPVVEIKAGGSISPADYLTPSSADDGTVVSASAVTGTESDHSHTAPGHSHTIDTQAAHQHSTSDESSHTHSFSDTSTGPGGGTPTAPVGSDSHHHNGTTDPPTSTTSVASNSHTHNVSGTTGAGSAHNHGNTGTSGSHNHSGDTGIAGASATSSDGSHSHSVGTIIGIALESATSGQLFKAMLMKA